MFEVGSMVLCTRYFELESKYPHVKFPQLGEYYWIRDVVFHSDTKKVGIRVWEIKNNLIETVYGYPEEPDFLSDNFIVVLKPLPSMDVNQLIHKCMKTK
jgi:hypothetical protein